MPPEAQHQVIISRVEDGDPLSGPESQSEPEQQSGPEQQFGADYVGSDFGLLRNGTGPAPESATPWSDLLRWWLFHETAVNAIEERVILWVRSDMVLP